MEEAQTLLTVVQTVESLRPAPRAHCLAGFWPRLNYIRANTSNIGVLVILRGENIAKEYFFDIFRLDACPFNGSWRGSAIR
jgi:hypothetical protein